VAQVTQAPAGTDSIEKQLNADLGNFFKSFEKSTAGINSSNFDTSHFYLSEMKRYYNSYQDNLVMLDKPGSEYQAMDPDLANIINITGAIVYDAENNYYYYKIIQIFRARSDSKNLSVYLQPFLDDASDSSRQYTNIQSNVSLIKSPATGLGVGTGILDQGVGNIYNYNFKVLSFLQNPDKAGLEAGYSVYDGYGIDGYQQVYDYLADTGQVITAVLAGYIEPVNRVSTKITVNVSDLSPHYNEVIAVYGVLTGNNSTPIGDGRVALSFNNATYTTRTNESGAYLFNLSINGTINFNTYDISTSYRGNISNDGTFLMSSQSQKLGIKVLIENVYLTMNCPQQTFMIGDKMVLYGNLSAENGVPIADANVSVFMQMQDPAAGSVSESIIVHGFTDVNGDYLINYTVPDNSKMGERIIFTAYTWPNSRFINATNSSRVQVFVNAAEPLFVYDSIPFIYFADDLIGIRGRLVTPNGYNISGQDVSASLSGNKIDGDVTGENGVFKLSLVVAPGGSPGIKTVAVTTPGNGVSVLGNSATVGSIIILPYDKTISLLLMAVTVLSLFSAAIILSSLYSRRRRVRPDRKWKR
jgi:hypothetical protein